MAASEPNTQVGKPDPSGFSAQIANAATLYHGRFAGIRGQTHATSQGDVAPYEDEAGMIFAGLAQNPGGLSEDVGDTSATVPPRVQLDLTPRILSRVTVTGAAAITDTLKPVYATDDETLTLTRPADDAEVVGVITRWHTSTTCDVLLLGLPLQIALGMAGGNRELFEIVTMPFASMADGDLVTSLPMPFHGRIISLHALVAEACTGTSGSILVNAEIGTTNVTAGVITVSTAAGGTVGTILDGTAVTAENVFHEGDLLSLEGASAAGTRTLGSLRIYALVERLPGC